MAERAQAPGPPDELRTAEVVGALSLATDLSVGFPFEHGLTCALLGVRLADRLGTDEATARQAYYGSLLFYIGCTTDAEAAAELFPGDNGIEHFEPVMFGSRRQVYRGIVGALQDPADPPLRRALRVARTMPKAARGYPAHVQAVCEVAANLSERLSLPEDVRALFPVLASRWDGKSPGLAGEAIPLALRIVHVARDAVFQASLGGTGYAVATVRERAGHAFDPEVAQHAVAVLADLADLAPVAGAEAGTSVWQATMAVEPGRLLLHGPAVDRALAAVGDFADLMSSYFVGHAAAVAALAGGAAERLGLAPEEVCAVRRAGHVHDVGRVAVPTSVWNRPGPLTADQWEQVRLHAYQTERVLGPSEVLHPLAALAGAHHERSDGSGYHRGSVAALLPVPARVLAAADAYRTWIEPRPHRPAAAPGEAAGRLAEQANAGLLDADAVGAVVAAAGEQVPPLMRPAGLTEREAQVVVLVARGLQTKQVGHRLEISPKTADRHLQHAYAKMGVSTRAAATLFAMQHGLTTWGELPIPHGSPRS